LNTLLGITLKIVSTFAFLAMATLIKLASEDMPIGELMFFRAFFAMIPLGIWLRMRGELTGAFRTKNITGHGIRSLSGSGGMYFGFMALALLPLPDATAIGYLAPLIATILAALLLKEIVRPYRWAAVAAGFCGMFLMTLPHFSNGTAAHLLSPGPALGALAGLFAACCNGFSSIQIRKLAQVERTGTIVFYFSLITSLIGLLTSIAVWRTPTPHEATLLVLAGICGGIGQILITSSYRFADASVVVSFEYTTLVWAVAIGFLVFGDVPQPIVFLGALVVVASGLYVIYRERQISRNARREAEAAVEPHL
jgi:drug/metabolite transporter (DMT)-like permease